jgi:hypothetical protein
MTCLRCRRRNSSPLPDFPPSTNQAKLASVVVVVILFSLASLAQDQPPAGNPPDTPSSQPQAENGSAQVTIPAGTRIALVLTHPIQSRYIRRGDDIYAQISSPVNSGNELVIPPGTFVQAKVDKLGRNGGRGELRLQSMSITFPDGYVTPISGPVTLISDDGYAIKDPGQRRFTGAFVLPLAGAGIGALIGHSVGSSESLLTTTLPPGCTGPPPFCLSSSLQTPGRKGIDTGIGVTVGAAIGGLAAVAMLVSSHHFFLDVGAPVEMTLEQPVSFEQNEVANAVRESEKRPVSMQPVEARPVPPPPPDTPPDRGTCYTPGTPGTPVTVMPGVPGPDGIPGPPTIIPGTPPTPGTPYPCP